MYILGIAAFYHDASASLIRNGEIVAAAHEERFSRIKNDASFPSSAIMYCIREAGISPSQIDHIVFYDKPILKFDRLLETFIAFAPKGFRLFATSFLVWLKDKLFQKHLIVKNLYTLLGSEVNWGARLLFSEHHLSHAASAFFPSPFGESAVLTIDGVGEWSTTSLFMGVGNNLKPIKEIQFPHSLGLLYSAFTYYLGFEVNSGEYKVMGLAPYGEPIYSELIKKYIVEIKEDGSFHLDMEYFNYCTGLSMTSKKFDELFKSPPRVPDSKILQFHMNLAASLQSVLEEIILKIAINIAKTTQAKNLCLAGGVALNCVANGKIQNANIFEKIWVQPAAGDAGGSLGAALAAYHIHLKQPRHSNEISDTMSGAYLGPSYSQIQIEAELNLLGAKYQTILDEEALIDLAARSLIEGFAIGWFQGRMEFGPRALGNRSILADPRSPSIQKELNLKVKKRESFRPFAPSVLVEDYAEWFDLRIDSTPYMLFVAPIKEAKLLKVNNADYNYLGGLGRINDIRSVIPAVTHIDNSARVQTVDSKNNPRFYKLLKRFKKLTGVPILVNTSFNVKDEPIVCSPSDAYRCMMSTNIDLLFIGNSVLQRSSQDLK